MDKPIDEVCKVVKDISVDIKVICNDIKIIKMKIREIEQQREIDNEVEDKIQGWFWSN
tara:strand:+ start:348 stop:521 length:174 start_codon:yes stop_codon:yes gene_type:complete